MCVLYWHLISIWTSFMVRTKYLHDLNDKEGHRLTRSHWLAHLFTNSHHERPSHSIFCRCRQWTVRAVLRLTWDKWQLTGCHASQQWGKRTCLSFLELSGSAILFLASCVRTRFSSGAPWGRNISALSAIMSDGLPRVTQIHGILLNGWTQPCTDYQAELAGQFILQCLPIVKTYSTFSQGKQCVTVFIIVSSSLTQLLKIGKFPTSQNHLFLSSSDSSSNTQQKQNGWDWERKENTTHAEEERTVSTVS